MAINIIRFEYHGEVLWGRLKEGKITPIDGDFKTTADFLSSNTLSSFDNLKAGPVDEASVKMLSPVTSNQQFICQGANYRQHMIESGMNPDEKVFNMIFTKASSCIVPANSQIVKPKNVKFLDYEIELGLVLKRDITEPVTISDSQLPDYIAGLVVVNDYSARDIQIPEMQFYKGKSFRTFGPIGPYLCLLQPEDFSLLYNLELLLTVNGEIRQKDNTKNIVYKAAETLTELSRVHDLFCGDLIATGTPAGCALSLPSPYMVKMSSLLPESVRWKLFLKAQSKRSQYLRHGDKVTASIRSNDWQINLGTQTNEIVEANIHE